MSDSESEEEILVMVEFAEPVPACTDSDKIKIVGLNTDSPIVQYEKQIFQGEWKDCIGTKMLFAEKEASEAWDPAFATQVSKQYECAYTTRKVLRLKSVVLTAKDKEDEEEEEEKDEEEEEDDSDDVGSDDADVKIIKTEAVCLDEPGTSASP